MAKKKAGNASQVLAAVEDHDLRSLEDYLAAGGDPNRTVATGFQKNVSLLAVAATVQFRDGVEALLRAGADPNTAATADPGNGDGETALHGAIAGSDTRPGRLHRSDPATRLRIVDLLLGHGADPEAIRNGEQLPLTMAAGAGRLEICRHLVDGGASATTWPPGCFPPLVAAAAHVPPHGSDRGRDHERVAEWLLDRGADVDAATPKGLTALMGAAMAGSERLVGLLVSRGADVLRRSADGRSPLHFAAFYATRAATDDEHELALRVVRALLEAGADPGSRNDLGERPADIAGRGRDPRVADALNGLGHE